MRFLIIALLLLPTFAKAEVPPFTQDSSLVKEECLKEGGNWRRIGLSQKESCDLPTKDGGKSCTKETDCESGCIVEKKASWKIFSKAESKCNDRKIKVGCFDFLDKEGKQQSICVD